MCSTMKLGFVCVRNTLCAVNAVGLVVGVSLIAAAAYGRSFGIVWSLSIISVVMVVGLSLILVSVLGLIGALRQNQMVLFSYILAMMFVFIFQLSVSCSCLTLGKEKQEKLLSMSWEMMSNETRRSLEQQLDCCGLINSDKKPQVCKSRAQCSSCGDVMLQRAAETLSFLGGVGLFCSFSQLVTMWLSVQYRNLKPPQLSSRTAGF